ncbi:DUF2470 domain-containing protein [Aspergillus undulatus]|uniref:DUF2470 domain-containing protein n=1 Tax=Aspergillus undulatus TaxID=1810928 RepID=UPI003CCD56D4
MSAAATDSSRKPFIISHMNADHTRSLSLYLRAYCSVSAPRAEQPTLEDIRNTDMVISAQGSRYTIPFDPPLSSLSEARERVVAMHKEALKRLGLSDVKMDRYIPPKGGQWVGFTLCAAVMVFYARRANFVPGGWVYETFGLDNYPGFTGFSLKWGPVIWWFLVLAHGFEAVVLLYWHRLRKYRVRPFSGVWWVWMVLGFVEGFPAWMRVDEEVSRVEGVEAERKKSS